MTALFPIIAATGGRAYADYEHVRRVMGEERPAAVVQGECHLGGLDALVKRWCRETGTPCFGVEANFTFYGKAGGQIRNGWMFDFLSIYKLVAFPGDRGTNNAVEQARKREILVRDERGYRQSEAA